jgi:hypothetical protein
MADGTYLARTLVPAKPDTGDFSSGNRRNFLLSQLRGEI